MNDHTGPDPAFRPSTDRTPSSPDPYGSDLRPVTPPAFNAHPAPPPYAQVAPPYPPQPFGQPQAFVPAKTPGVAVLLSLLWLGAGHLYAGRTTTGIIFMVVNFFLALVSLIPFAFLLTVPVWFGLFIAAAITSHGAAVAYNERLGIRRV